jgi:hypothetical protein
LRRSFQSWGPSGISMLNILPTGGIPSRKRGIVSTVHPTVDLLVTRGVSGTKGYLGRIFPDGVDLGHKNRQFFPRMSLIRNGARKSLTGVLLACHFKEGVMYLQHLGGVGRTIRRAHLTTRYRQRRGAGRVGSLTVTHNNLVEKVFCFTERRAKREEVQIQKVKG